MALERFFLPAVTSLTTRWVRGAGPQLKHTPGQEIEPRGHIPTSMLLAPYLWEPKSRPRKMWRHPKSMPPPQSALLPLRRFKHSLSSLVALHHPRSLLQNLTCRLERRHPYAVLSQVAQDIDLLLGLLQTALQVQISLRQDIDYP